MTVGEEEVLNERQLLTKVESGLMMSGADAVRFLVIHCSATRCTQDYKVEQLLRDHKARGFRTIGYHFYIRRNGEVTQHRQLLEVGAHARGFNRCSIGICYEGGLNTAGIPKDTRTPAQKRAMVKLLRDLRQKYPNALIVGHNVFNPQKACPCFDAAAEYKTLLPASVNNLATS